MAMTKQEKKWQAESDAHSLAEAAAAVNADKARLAAAPQAAKKMVAEAEQSASAAVVRAKQLKKLSTRKLVNSSPGPTGVRRKK